MLLAGKVTWFSSSLGRSSDSQSRWLSPNQSSSVFGWNGTVLRNAAADLSPLPSRLIRKIRAYCSDGLQMLHGAPTGT